MHPTLRGPAMTQAVSRCDLTGHFEIQTQDIPYGMRWWTKWHWHTIFFLHFRTQSRSRRLYRTWEFIKVFKTARHFSLSARQNSFYAIIFYFFHINLNIILPSSSRYSKRSLVFQVSPPKPSMHFSSPHACYMPRPSHSRFHHPNNIRWAIQIIKLIIT